MKFLAAVLREQNRPLELEHLEVPNLGVGQVLVKILYSGVCGKQLVEQAGVLGPDPHLPHTLGHEGAGIVIETGFGVKHVAVGDHVVGHWRKGVGIDAEPAAYKGPRGRVGAGWVTTFQEYAVISENRLTAIPKDISMDLAALFGCAITTALGCVSNDAQLKLGQSIAVIGCGGVGLNIIQAAGLASGNPIVAVDLYDKKLEYARYFGATHTLHSADLIRDILPKGADVCVETTGLSHLIEKAYQATSASGKTILVGQMRHDQHARINTLPMHGGRTIMASEGGQTNPSVDIPRYLGLYRAGKLKLKPLITHQYPLRHINEALDRMRAGEVGRCVLEMEHA